VLKSMEGRAKSYHNRTHELPPLEFHHPFDYVEKLYWGWRNSDYKNLPDSGGLLDQNPRLMEDLYTYHAAVEFFIDKHKPKAGKA